MHRLDPGHDSSQSLPSHLTHHLHEVRDFHMSCVTPVLKPMPSSSEMLGQMFDRVNEWAGL
jgi:hypothetical protein